MSLFWLVSFVILAAAFGVLVWTFVWVARLLAERSRAEAEAAAVASEEPDGEHDAVQSVQEPEEAEVPSLEEAAREEAAKEREQKKLGTGVNATLGLVLGVVSCAAFWLSPLALAVSLAGVYFSANALWIGLRSFGVLIPRAVAGIALSLSSVALIYGYHFANPFG